MRARQPIAVACKQINATVVSRRTHRGNAESRAVARLLLQMRLNRARHPDRAEQERDEADEIEKAVKIVERFAEILFPFRNRVVFETGLLDLRRESLHSVDVNVRRKLHEIEVARHASRLDEMRGGEILQRNVNARREARGRRRFARHLRQGAGNRENNSPILI